MDPRQLEIERDLRPLLEGEVRTDPIALALFSTAACIFRRKPLAVVSPRSESDVARVVAYAASAGVPVTARGGGSSLAGQALGPGIVLCFRPALDPRGCRRGGARGGGGGAGRVSPPRPGGGRGAPPRPGPHPL